MAKISGDYGQNVCITDETWQYIPHIIGYEDVNCQYHQWMCPFQMTVSYKCYILLHTHIYIYMFYVIGTSCINDLEFLLK